MADDGHLLGICTERDIVFDVVANGLDPVCTPVSAVMTTDRSPSGRTALRPRAAPDV
ncbi:MAG: hypothetical protein R3E34_11750 [Rhodocyclaceae bacterium]